MFYARLNRTAGIDAARLRAGSQPSPDAPAQRLRVIEDDPHVQARLVQGLLGAGHGVETASSAAQAAGLLLAARFDGLTLDRLLPDRNGRGLLADIRNDSNSASAKVIAEVVRCPGIHLDEPDRGR